MYGTLEMMWRKPDVIYFDLLSRGSEEKRNEF
jgi:hypothetical protein